MILKRDDALIPDINLKFLLFLLSFIILLFKIIKLIEKRQKKKRQKEVLNSKLDGLAVKWI